LEEYRRFAVDTELEGCSKETRSWRKVIGEAMVPKRSEGTLKKEEEKEEEGGEEEEENRGVTIGSLLRILQINFEVY
jgi:hypothetical protein